MSRAYGRACGQALIELALLVSVLGAVLLWAIPELHQRLQQRYAGQQLLALHLQQSPLREQVGLEPWELEHYQTELGLSIGEGYTLEMSKTDDYSFAQGMQPLWSLLDWQDGFSLPLKNLHAASLVASEDDSASMPWLSYLRLSDGWAPKHLHELIGRPQALTTSHYLQQIGFEHVQSLVAVLPFAREFAPSQLRLGFVDVDVVPSGAVSVNTNSCSSGEYCSW